MSQDVDRRRRRLRGSDVNSINRRISHVNPITVTSWNMINLPKIKPRLVDVNLCFRLWITFNFFNVTYSSEIHSPYINNSTCIIEFKISSRKSNFTVLINGSYLMTFDFMDKNKDEEGKKKANEEESLEALFLDNRVSRRNFTEKSWMSATRSSPSILSLFFLSSPSFIFFFFSFPFVAEKKRKSIILEKEEIDQISLTDNTRCWYWLIDRKYPQVRLPTR